MQITGQQLKNVVSENRHLGFDLSSRVSTEYLIWFTYNVFKEIGEHDAAEKVMELIDAIESLDTSELVELHIWD